MRVLLAETIKRTSVGSVYQSSLCPVFFNCSGSKSSRLWMRGPLFDAADYETSRKLGLELLSNIEMRRYTMIEVAARVLERIGDGPTFLSFDIDFVDPAYAPGTGTPEVGGVTSWEVQQLLRGLRGAHFVAFDLVEVLPSYDPAQVTALLAANVAYEMLSLVAAKKRLHHA